MWCAYELHPSAYVFLSNASRSVSTHVFGERLYKDSESAVSPLEWVGFVFARGLHVDRWGENLMYIENDKARWYRIFEMFDLFVPDLLGDSWYGHLVFIQGETVVWRV